MLNKNKIIMICLFLMVGATNIYAQPSANMWEKRKEFFEQHSQKAMNMADLTPEQFKELEVHRQEMLNKMKSIMHKMMTKKKEIAAEIQKDEVDREQIEKLNNEMKVVMLEMADHRMRSVLRMREILSVEQFRTIFGYVQKHMKQNMMSNF